MIILPAIDIKGGRCVRLYQGDFSKEEVVAENYLQTALQFQEDGAEWLHMVDLDGAVDGRTVNREIFLNTANHTSLKVEVGGGIRDRNTIEDYLENGVERVILGSVALSKPALVKEVVKHYPGRIAVGIDAKDGYVAVNGWLDTSRVYFTELAKQMEQAGVEYIIYTDIAKDGTLSGPNLQHLEELKSVVSCKIIASGGIHTIQDIQATKALGLYGTICGKSIYSGSLNLKEAISTASAAGNKNR